MSLDNQATVNMGNLDSTPPKRSGGALKWIFGGCGCLGLMMALCIGGVVWFGLSKIDQVRQEAKTVIESSTVVQQHLGSPVAIDGEVLGSAPDGAPQFQFDVSGPLGSGTVTTVSEMDQKIADFVITSYTLEFNGQEFDLNADDEFNLDVEGMDGF